MSARGLINTVREVREGALGVVWRHWRALGALTTSPAARSLVDPEALVLGSLGLCETERRLPDALRWWAAAGAPLLNVTRIRTLARRFPESVHIRLGEFAHLAVQEGGDFRWRPLVRRSPSLEGIVNPPALLLRLRLALGVTVKADLIWVLLGRSGSWLTVKILAEALGYTPQSVRRAAEDLAAARFIRATTGTPASYRLDPKPWHNLLEAPAQFAPWRHWVPVFAFVTALSEWVSKETEITAASEYILSVRARDIIAGHQDAFTRNDLVIPQLGDYPGEAYLPAFRETLAALRKWLDESG
jgi:hypothetical protein